MRQDATAGGASVQDKVADEIEQLVASHLARRRRWLTGDGDRCRTVEHDHRAREGSRRGNVIVTRGERRAPARPEIARVAAKSEGTGRSDDVEKSVGRSVPCRALGPEG